MEQFFSPQFILLIIAAYFAFLLFISYLTGRKATNDDFFLAGRKSPWYIVAFGMIGASLSGVTFISIPGVVGADGLNQDFSYMQMVFGYFLGYIVIAEVLMPLYYRLNLTSIYGYLDQRLGKSSYKTGAAFFLVSRTIQAAFRLFLVAIVLQKFVMDAYGVPFFLTVSLTIVLIWVYTFRGGIKTIVYTDTIQTLSMILAVLFTVIALGNELGMGIKDIYSSIRESQYSQMFFFENGWSDQNNFFKQFISGALICLVMTGLDQDMMQKNLSCKNIGEAKKNMYSFYFVLIFVNILFLSLGALLYIYAGEVGFQIPEARDQFYPMVALGELPTYVGVLFVIGLIAAAYSSADSALTSLTTSFCVDFLNFEEKGADKKGDKRKRMYVHVGFSVLLLLVILYFNSFNDESVITGLFRFATYTYGPLLGLFAFGILTSRHAEGWPVILVCILAPILSVLVDNYPAELLNGFEFGYLILLFNGLLTFIGLYIISLFQQDGENN